MIHSVYNTNPTCILGVWIKSNITRKQLDKLLDLLYTEKHLHEQGCYISVTYNPGRSVCIGCEGRDFTASEVRCFIAILEPYCIGYDFKKLKETYS